MGLRAVAARGVVLRRTSGDGERAGWMERVDGLVGGVRGQEVGGAETAWRTCLDRKGSGSGALANPKRSREACPPTADRWSLDVHDARVYITTLHLHLES